MVRLLHDQVAQALLRLRMWKPFTFLFVLLILYFLVVLSEQRKLYTEPLQIIKSLREVLLVLRFFGSRDSDKFFLKVDVITPGVPPFNPYKVFLLS